MLHVRLVSPVALTEQLTSLLATAPGVQNMIVGAMVVGPEYNAIMGVALGISRRVRSSPHHQPGRRVGGRVDCVLELARSVGSLLQLLLNVSLLIVVGAAGLSAQRAIWRRRRP